MYEKGKVAIYSLPRRNVARVTMRHGCLYQRSSHEAQSACFFCVFSFHCDGIGYYFLNAWRYEQAYPFLSGFLVEEPCMTLSDIYCSLFRDLSVFSFQRSVPC